MEQESTSGNGYTKKHLWQGIIISAVITLIACGLIYFFLLSDRSFSFMSSSKYQGAESNSTELVNEEVAVTYTDSGFSPSTLTVKRGNTVSFKNTSSNTMHIASDPHPAHNEYPTKGGCVSSTFDSCNSIWPSQAWSFKFEIVGKWEYHNHLNPSEDGTIIVE